MERLVSQDLSELLEIVEHLELLVHLELTDNQEPQEYRGHLVQPGPLDFLDPVVNQVLLDHKVLQD
jgi:hypothetical protein